jgi:hypothetical protein
VKYLAVTGFRSLQELQAYLYHTAVVVDSDVTLHGTLWAVVEVNADADAQYQADRLSSGMMGVTMRNTAYGAAMALLRRI